MGAFDFKEIPSAQKGEDRDAFELFAREFLQCEDFEIVQDPDRGPDGGCDLVVSELRSGPGGKTKIVWLVSCKHFVNSGKSVGVDDELNILERLSQHGASAFMGFYSTVASSGLTQRLRGIAQENIRFEFYLWDHEKIEAKLLANHDLTLADRFFPKSVANWRTQTQTAEDRAIVQGIEAITEEVDQSQGLDNWSHVARQLCDVERGFCQEVAEQRGRALVIALLLDGGRSLRSSLDVKRAATAISMNIGEFQRQQRVLVALKLLPRSETPKDLARDVLEHALSRPFPLEESIIEHAPELLPRLLDDLEGFELKVETRAAVAERILYGYNFLAPLLQPEAELIPIWFHIRVLDFLACYQPRALASRIKWACELIHEGTVAPQIRDSFVHALVHLRGRKGAIEEAESALFILASVDDQVGSRALKIWSEIFLVEMNPTYRSSQQNLAVLRRRVTDATPRERVVIIEGLRQAVKQEDNGPRNKELDGPPPRVENFGESWELKKKAWDLLVCLSDAPDGLKALLESFPTLPFGPVLAHASSSLISIAGNLPEEKRRKLRDSVDLSIRRHESAQDVPTSLNELRTALEPRDLVERLRDSVGRWDHKTKPSEITSEEFALELAEADRQLAIDVLIGTPPPILLQLDWLHSQDAARSQHFMRQLGREDREEVVLSDLLAREPNSTLNTLPPYLGGMVLDDRRARADNVVETVFLGHLEWSDVLVATALHLGSGSTRVQWLIDGLKSQTFRTVYRGSWRRLSYDSDPVIIQQLVDALIEAAEWWPDSWRIASGLLSSSWTQPEFHEWRLDTLERLLSIAAIDDVDHSGRHDLEQFAEDLANAGRCAAVADVASRVLLGVKSRHDGGYGWALLRQVAEAASEIAWDVAKQLFAGTDDANSLANSLAYHLISKHFPAPQVIEWIGESAGRAESAARFVTVIDQLLDEGSISRYIVTTFGWNHEASRELRSRAQNRQLNAFSISANEKAIKAKQLELARKWEGDEDYEVKTWVEELISVLEAQKQHSH